MPSELDMYHIAKDILKIADMNKIMNIVIDGPLATGKTTLAETLSYLITDTSTTKFNTKYLKDNDLIDLPKMISNLDPVNHVFILDEVILHSKKPEILIRRVREFFETIRHTTSDFNHMLIFIFTSINNSIRTSLGPFDAYFFTGITSYNIDRVSDIMEGNYDHLMFEFITASRHGIEDGKFNYYSSDPNGDEDLVYHYRNPHAPALYYNHLRHMCRLTVYSKMKRRQEKYV